MAWWKVKALSHFHKWDAVTTFEKYTWIFQNDTDTQYL